MIPLDRRGRRALDEALADWSHEVSLAATTWDRVAVGLRGFAALAVTLSLVLGREVRRAASHSTLAVAVLWIALFIGAVRLQWLVSPPRFLGDLPAGTWEQMDVGWTAITVAAWVPLAFFLAAALVRRAGRAEVPYVGLAVAAALAVLIVDGWLIPSMDIQTPVFTHNRDGQWMFLNLSELGSPTLLVALADPGHSSLSAIRQLSEALARAALAGALVLIAGHLRSIRTWPRVLALAFLLVVVHGAGEATVTRPDTDFVLGVLIPWVQPVVTALLLGLSAVAVAKLTAQTTPPGQARLNCE